MGVRSEVREGDWVRLDLSRDRRFRPSMIAVDTNILVYAHRADAARHRIARERLTELLEGSRACAIPWPCVHEFLAVVTHPRDLSAAVKCRGGGRGVGPRGRNHRPWPSLAKAPTTCRCWRPCSVPVRLPVRGFTTPASRPFASPTGWRACGPPIATSPTSRDCAPTIHWWDDLKDFRRLRR